VDREFQDWLRDLGRTHSRDVEFHRTVDLYWTLKVMMGKALVEP